MNEQQPLPAGEAREDERELEKVADRIENAEPRPGIVHDRTALPATVVDPDSGKSSRIVAPDGTPASIQGEVVTTLSALEARHEELRRVKPCLSCAHAGFPMKGSREAAEIAAFVSDGHHWGYVAPAETAAEYMHCRAWDKCVHVSQHCLPAWGSDRHVYRGRWLAALKAFIARRRAGRE